MTDPVDPYQNENSSFSGSGERPEQTEEQISKAFDVTEFMRDVIDPELGINVVDLGLVYDLWFEEDNGKEIVMINMTLTSPACPLTDVIAEQVEDIVKANKLADAVRINWVWMPPWGPQMITDCLLYTSDAADE